MHSGDELLIGTTEAAMILGVDPATVTRWAINGKLPYLHKMPGEKGAWLFNAGVVRRMAQERLLRRAG